MNMAVVAVVAQKCIFMYDGFSLPHIIPVCTLRKKFAIADIQ
jgi:hypothetical protein